MAITKEISIVSITDAGSQFGGQLLSVTVKMIIKQDGVEILNKDFTAQYQSTPGLTVDECITVWVKAIKDLMQSAIDNYAREQSLLKNTKLATALSWLQANLNVTGL